MPVKINIVRHAQSRHNVEVNGDEIRDPSLTAEGMQQAKALGNTFPYTQRVRHVISSPMRRAIQTGLLAFDPLIKQGVKIILAPDLQESSARPSDIGSPAPELREEFGDAIDTKFLSDGWFSKDASASYGGRDQKKVAERARRARLYIRSIAKTLSDGDHILVVAHSGFVKHLIQGAPSLGNAEFRSCQFVDLLGDDEQAILVEVSPQN
ncbi:histidine phosphatase superfamily [Xylaria telfairii]|nr:histidine phosphatase superfamily [Xylaria telfairii]